MFLFFSNIHFDCAGSTREGLSMAERQAQWVSVYEAEIFRPWQAQGCRNSLQAFPEIQIGVSLRGKICKNRFDKFLGIFTIFSPIL